MANEQQSSDLNRLTAGEPGRASSTYLPDWVWMSDAPDQAKVYYWAIRSFIFEKDDQHAYELTDDDLAPMMRRSVDSVVRARKAAEKHGLITVLAEQRRSGYTGGRKHSLPVLRLIHVQIDPPEGYDGPVNVFTEKRRVSAQLVDNSPARASPSSTKDQENPQVTGGSADVRNLESQVTGGSADLPNTNADLPNSGADLPNIAPPDQGKAGPQVPSSSPLNEDPPSPWHGEAPDARELAEGKGKGETQKEEPEDELTRKREKDRAAAFLGEVQAKVPRELADSLTTEEKHRITELATDARLLRVPNATVMEQLSNVTGTRYLGKAWEQKLARLVEQARMEAAEQQARKKSRPACRRCGAPEGAGAHERTVLTDPSDPHAADQPCPDCRSSAVNATEAS